MILTKGRKCFLFVCLFFTKKRLFYPRNHKTSDLWLIWVLWLARPESQQYPCPTLLASAGLDLVWHLPFPPADSQAAHSCTPARTSPSCPWWGTGAPAAHQGQDREGLLRAKLLELAPLCERKPTAELGPSPSSLKAWIRIPRSISCFHAEQSGWETPSPGNQSYYSQDLMWERFGLLWLNPHSAYKSSIS